MLAYRALQHNYNNHNTSNPRIVRLLQFFTGTEDWPEGAHQGPKFVQGGSTDTFQCATYGAHDGFRPPACHGRACGNTVGLAGVDAKDGHYPTLDSAHNIADMKYSVSPVVKVWDMNVNYEQGYAMNYELPM